MKKPPTDSPSPALATSLSEKQSVRTTFKLSKKSLDAFNSLIEAHRLKPKEIFDLICSFDQLIDIAVKSIDNESLPTGKEYVRKTYVISQQDKRLLNRLSKKHGVPRDMLVDRLILAYEGILKLHKKKEREQEEKAYKIVSEFSQNAGATLKELSDLLDKDSPILERFGAIELLVENLNTAIYEKLEYDTPIDPDFLATS